MIPMALSAAHAAIAAWKSKIGTDDECRLALLGDDDLAQLRRVVAALYDDIRDALDMIDTTLSGRIMSRSPRSDPDGGGGGRPAGSDASPGRPQALVAPAAPGTPHQ